MLVSFDAIASPGAPLFEEECGALAVGLGLDLEDPFLAHGAGFWATFSANDNPVDVFQVKIAEAFKEGFAGKESNGGRQRTKGIDSMFDRGGFDGDAQPNIGWDFADGKEFGHSFGALCEELIVVVGRLSITSKKNSLKFGVALTKEI